MTKIPALWRLFRFELPLTAGVCVVLGQLLALGDFPPAREMILGFLAVFLISAAALILNDYFDIESDKINAPYRPLPAGLVTKGEVIFLFGAVTALGFLASSLLNLSALLAAILVWVVGVLYNWRFKKFGIWGNLMVGFSVGMTFLFGGLAVGQLFEKMVWFFAILSLFINLGEEIAADAMDVEGDRRTGSRSLPVLLGSENALKVSAGIFLFVCGLTPLPFLLGWMKAMYFAPLLLMDLVILFSTAKLLDPTQANRRAYIRWIYLGALAAILLVIVFRPAFG